MSCSQGAATSLLDFAPLPGCAASLRRGQFSHFMRRYRADRVILKRVQISRTGMAVLQ